MANPVKVARREHEKLKEEKPEVAVKVEERISGEIYDLRPDPLGYSSDRVVEVIYEEGEYKSGLEY